MKNENPFSQVPQLCCNGKLTCFHLVISDSDLQSVITDMHLYSIFISGSGDHDMCVPFTGSEAWTRSLGYKVVDEWRPWTSNGQVAGYLLLHIFLHQTHNRNR